MIVLELQTTARELQRKQRKDLLNMESAPVRIKASGKGGTVTVGLISSASGHDAQVVGLDTLLLISRGLRQQECLPASAAACLHQPKQLGKVL